MSNKKIWFITGASRGMGVDFAKAALAAGHAVVASGPDSDRVEVRPGGLDGVAARRVRAVGHHHHYRQSGVLPRGAPHGAIDELRRAVYRGLRRAQGEAARVLEIQNGQQSGGPAKLARALIIFASQGPPPRRFIAGADAIATAEQKVADLKTQIDAERDLWTSLAFE
jgi:hypothetical protein